MGWASRKRLVKVLKGVVVVVAFVVADLVAAEDWEGVVLVLWEWDLGGKGFAGLRSEGGGRLTAADAIVGSFVVVIVFVVDLRARDLQDWLVQVVHFALSWDDDDVVGLVVDEAVDMSRYLFG